MLAAAVACQKMRPRWLCVATASMLLMMVGCHRLPFFSHDYRLDPPPPIEVPVANPAHVGNVDPDFLWRMIVDSVDDYFQIEEEYPVRRNNQNRLEGKLISYPRVSGTMLEPWQRDAAPGFEKLQSTFQTIRRTAKVNVINEPTGYMIEVEVMKEQEDVDQSLFATAGSAAQRHDGTIIRNENQIRQMPITLGWFEIGRDLDLERRIMEGILGRISSVEPPRRKILH